jgi:hypothetical protein
MSRVQVYGPPEERALEADERLCTDDDADDAFVVFHPAAVQLTGRGWSCAGCAFTTTDDGSTER